MKRDAIFSECGKYRYALMRYWDEELPSAMCIGLNPSTANARNDDPTIRNLCRILQNLGYGSLLMTNLFSLISPYPEDLRTCPDPLKENDRYLQYMSQFAKDVVFCWGNFPMAEYRAKAVKVNFPMAKCFGKNVNGSPKHPLYLKSSTTLKEYL